MKIKQGILYDEQIKIIEWAFKYFKHLTNEDYFYALLKQETNWDISIKLVNESDELMGVYLFGNKQLSSLIKNTKYDQFNGVEGVLLAVDSSIRGQGWGNKLKDFPATLGFDYIWGQQLKNLNNIDDWLKRRILIGETHGCYITLEDFLKKNLHN